jgi:alpha-L-fucosidase
VRFTCKDDALYAVLLDWPTDGRVVLAEFAEGRPATRITDVQLLGCSTKIAWKTTADGLQVQLPSGKPCEHAWTLKIMVDD